MAKTTVNKDVNIKLGKDNHDNEVYLKLWVITKLWKAERHSYSLSEW